MFRDMIEVLDLLIFVFIWLSSVQICVRGLSFSTLGVKVGGFIWGHLDELYKRFVDLLRKWVLVGLILVLRIPL